MAKKAVANGDRSDPKKNKSLALRNVIKKMPKAKFTEVAAAVKAEYGHEVKPALYYMLRAKGNMKANRKANQAKVTPTKQVAAPMNSAALWVDAIKTARQLLKVTGSVENATALLEAVEQ